MENFNSFKVIGNISEEKKEQQKKELKGQLFEKHLSSLDDEQIDEIEKFEHTKTEEQCMLIDFANKSTNELMEKLSIPSYNVPLRNFHLLAHDIYKKKFGDDNFAMTVYPQQAIFMDDKIYEKNNFMFSITSFHELLHLKGHLTLEINETLNGKVLKTPYREGVSVRALQRSGFNGEYYDYFRGIHEAIVSSYELEYIKKIL